MKDENWQLVSSTNFLAIAEIQKGMLLENGIDAVLMNKQDSSYLSFGLIEVFVREKDLLTAQLLIDSYDTIDE